MPYDDSMMKGSKSIWGLKKWCDYYGVKYGSPSKSLMWHAMPLNQTFYEASLGAGLRPQAESESILRICAKSNMKCFPS